MTTYVFFLSREVSNLWETTSPRFPTFETTVVGLDRARSLAVGENCWNVRPQALQSRMVNAWYPGTCKQIKEKIMHMRNEEKMVDMEFRL